MNYPATVPGQQLGLHFPTTIEQLQLSGAAFLTEAFHASGALSAGNRVTAITHSKEFFGGGMGRKLTISVTYEHPEQGLHTNLFLKFPRDFGDPLRDLFGPLMEPEVRFALLSRRADFPIAVPKCYFADYDAATASGILITERIAYGENGIERCHDKCLDYEIPELLEHYQALTRTMARLAGYHKAGRFGPDTEQQFPCDADKMSAASRIPYTPAQLDEKLAKLRIFVDRVPQLFPTHLLADGFLDLFIAEVPLVLAHEQALQSYLNSKTDFIALCHWNVNVDNAWFWRDADGLLQAGLLDWGSVGQMNVAQAFYGLTCAAETDFLNEHRSGLIELFVSEYHRHGGPLITAEELRSLYKLSVAILGVAWMLDAPSLIEAELPEVETVRDRRDPKFREVFLARAQAQVLTVFLNEWHQEDIGSAVRSRILC